LITWVLKTLITSYVKQDGVSIRRKETKQSGNIRQAHLMTPESKSIYNVQQMKDNAIEKYNPTTRDTATLTPLYNNPHRRLPQAFKCLACLVPRASRSSRLSCLVPRASRASRARVPLVPRASRARAPLKHVRLSATCASRQLSPSTPERFLHTSSPSAFSTLICLSSNSLSSGLLKLSTHVLSALRPALFWARRIRTANRTDTPPLPPAASRFRKQADDEPSQRRSAQAFWRETSPRTRRVSIRPAGSVTTRCTFDGECRWWCV